MKIGFAKNVIMNGEKKIHLLHLEIAQSVDLKTYSIINKKKKNRGDLK
jgi:hypothetical protein